MRGPVQPRTDKNDRKTFNEVLPEAPGAAPALKAAASHPQGLGPAVARDVGPASEAAGSPVGASSVAGPTTTPAVQQAPIGESLRQEIARAIGALPGQLSVVERQNSGPANPTRQFIVTVESGLASPAVASPGAPIQALPLPPDAGHFNHDPVALVKDRLSRKGIDPTRIQFTQWDDTITGLGGNRIFRYIRAELPNGVKENFSLEWAMAHPDITATEIAGLLRRA